MALLSAGVVGLIAHFLLRRHELFFYERVEVEKGAIGREKIVFRIEVKGKLDQLVGKNMVFFP